jgi:hypothetical protein
LLIASAVKRVNSTGSKTSLQEPSFTFTGLTWLIAELQSPKAPEINMLNFGLG